MHTCQIVLKSSNNANPIEEWYDEYLHWSYHFETLKQMHYLNRV